MTSSWRFAILAWTTVAIAGCTGLVSRAGSGLADNLTSAILNQDDPTTVRDGVPAYLLLIDSMIEGDPQSVDVLLAGARLYGAYAGGFAEDETRAARLAQRGYGYAKRAACIELKALCLQHDQPFEKFAPALQEVQRADVAVLYGLGAAWSGWIQTHAADWGAIAEVPKVEAILERVLALDETYENGMPQLYLGVLNSLRPASLGGVPERGRAHFERALELSGGKNQMARVLFAEYYARLLFDQELHDRLLNEALAADPVAPRLTLTNILAQDRARILLESGKDYF